MNVQDPRRERQLVAAAATFMALLLASRRIGWYEGIAIFEVLAFTAFVMVAEAHLRAWWAGRRRGSS
jgi:hypothetical protein